MTDGLVLDDHAMLMLQDIAEHREAVNAIPSQDPRMMIPIEISNLCRMEEALIGYIHFLLSMRDVEPCRSMAWHVYLSSEQIEQIRSLSERMHAPIRLEDNKFVYGYPPAMIVEREYWRQRAVARLK